MATEHIHNLGHWIPTLVFQRFSREPRDINSLLDNWPWPPSLATTLRVEFEHSKESTDRRRRKKE